MKKIDIHTHILPEHLPNFKQQFQSKGGYIQLDHQGCSGHEANMVRDDGTFFRKVGPNTWDGNHRLRDCDHTDVAVQVLSTVPVMFHYWAPADHAMLTSQFLNDHLAEVCHKWPKRFVGLCHCAHARRGYGLQRT